MSGAEAVDERPAVLQDTVDRRGVVLVQPAPSRQNVRMAVPMIAGIHDHRVAGPVVRSDSQCD